MDECLHCHLLDAIAEYLEAHADCDVNEVIEAIAFVLGDFMAAADADGRSEMRSHFNGRLANKLAFHDTDGTIRAGYLRFRQKVVS